EDLKQYIYDIVELGSQEHGHITLYKKPYAMRMVQYGYTVVLKIASLRAKIIFGQPTKINNMRRCNLCHQTQIVYHIQNGIETITLSSLLNIEGKLFMEK